MPNLALVSEPEEPDMSSGLQCEMHGLSQESRTEKPAKTPVSKHFLERVCTEPYFFWPSGDHVTHSLDVISIYFHIQCVCL